MSTKLRMKHTNNTSSCNHTKKNNIVEGECCCWHKTSDRKNARKQKCRNKADRQAHMHTETMKFALVNSCAYCNRQWNTTMYVEEKDCHWFTCDCEYQRPGMQSCHHETFVYYAK